MISWRDASGGLHQGSLFDVFAALARGEAWSFPALRPHQREPWHAFTVQVAALALIRAGVEEMPTQDAAWRDLLLALTPDHPGGEAWDLVAIPSNRRTQGSQGSPAPAGIGPSKADRSSWDGGLPRTRGGGECALSPSPEYYPLH